LRTLHAAPPPPAGLRGPGPLRKVAVVGSGIAGLAAVHALHPHTEVTLFEAGDYFGGHTHTVDVRLPDRSGTLVTHGVDTGFLVFNERTYPQLIALFAELGVATAPSDMSFSVQAPRAATGSGRGRLEWSGTSLGGVFAQRRNMLDVKFLRMLRDILRFNALATRLATSPGSPAHQQTLGDFLDAERFSVGFRDWYFLPMMACIWSCPTRQMLEFPVATMLRFCYNHGLIQVTNRPQWHTVAGGARQYVERILAPVADKRLSTPVQRVVREAGGVLVITDHHAERFDKVVLATHPDQSLALLSQPSEAESQVLGAIRYQPNRALLHTDVSVLPTRRKAWAAWNYESAGGDADAVRRKDTVDAATPQVCLHYLINQLQPLPFAQAVMVSLNPLRSIDPATVLGDFSYAHPVLDLAATRAQQRLPDLQGQRHTYFCGAWAGYGFHEDGLKSGLAAAQALLASSTTRQAA
jgi:uncharacterized protein